MENQEVRKLLELTENPRVGSSILSLGTTIKTGTYEQSKVPVFIFRWEMAGKKFSKTDIIVNK